jgi:hypothetical protein
MNTARPWADRIARAVDERPLDDPGCLATSDALVIDGANGVCRDPRLGQTSAGLASGVALVLASLVAALALTRARLDPRVRARAALCLAALACLPGWYTIATTRADAPQHLERTASEISALHDALRTFARRRGCAQVRENACVACEPIARLALTGLHCDRPAEVRLHEGALGGRCEERAGALVCGGPP